ncbi:MAG: hypothetical protein IPL33_13955 [Sphingobacteriales bacterium]|nr:hypothetical protein [Sphingobacteriales bacterium]
MYNVAEGTANVTLSISNVNGGTADANASNNSLSQEVSGVTPVPGKKYWQKKVQVLGALYTRARVIRIYARELRRLFHTRSRIPNADPMAISEYDTPLSNAISGYPSSLVDRSATEVDPARLGECHD